MSDDGYAYFDPDAARIEVWMIDQANAIRNEHKRNPTDEEWKPIQEEAQRRWEAVQKARDTND